MVRVLNFFCVALIGLAILGLYHISEKTRVAKVELSGINRQIAQQRSAIAVLEAEWQHVAAPDRVQALAQARLGMNDAATAQLSSFDLLPRREADAPLNGAPLRNANAVVAPGQPAAILSPANTPPGF